MKSAGKIILRPMGEYDPSITYRYLDLVTYNNCLYIVRCESVVGVSPDSGDTSKWIFLLNGTADLTTKSGTVISQNADYAEVGEWADGNPDDEDRIGYFVAVDDTQPGITMVKANSSSDVRGVTVRAPAFSGNCTSGKFDRYGELVKQYDFVAVMGLASVIDNGRCIINERCMPADDGTAIPSDNDMGYHVIDRIDDTHILIAVKPGADMLNRIKTFANNTRTILKEKVKVVIGSIEPVSGPVLWFNTSGIAQPDEQYIMLDLTDLSDAYNIMANIEGEDYSVVNVGDGEEIGSETNSYEIL